MARKKENLEIKTQLTYEIYKKFIYFNVYCLSLKKINIFIYILILLVGILIQFIIGFNLLLTTLISFLLLLFIVLIIVTKLQIKQYYNSVKNLIEKENYIFKDKILEIKSKNSNVKINYNNLYFIKETNNAIYIYISTAQAFIFDKIQIGEENFTKLKEFIIKKVEKNKYKYYK